MTTAAGRPARSRIGATAVMALHAFVFLYFFNMVPNLSKELHEGLEGWRGLVDGMPQGELAAIYNTNPDKGAVIPK